MADDLPLALARSEIVRAREALARDAQYLAEDASRFAANIIKGGPYGGDASRLAQGALQLAVQSARLDAQNNALAYLTARDEKDNDR